MFIIWVSFPTGCGSVATWVRGLPAVSSRACAQGVALLAGMSEKSSARPMLQWAPPQLRAQQPRAPRTWSETQLVAGQQPEGLRQGSAVGMKGSAMAQRG